MQTIIEQHQLAIAKHYQILEYLGGHYPTTGRCAGQLKNPIWRVLDTITNTTKLIMHCETDTLCILCDESLQLIRNFERKYCDEPQQLTFYQTAKGYIACRIPKIDKVLYMHQIITNHYGNGQGTNNDSVDHIDRNPLNNAKSNLRIATREEQEQNSKGIAPNTKRARQTLARALPDGIEQHMLRKYVVYYVETYNKEKGLKREYFRVEHPSLHPQWESTSSGKVSIFDKLASANKVAEDLENGIMPQKPDRELPKYFTIDKTSKYLVFDRKKNGQRYGLRYVINHDLPIAEQLETLKTQLIAKYDEHIFE